MSVLSGATGAPSAETEVPEPQGRGRTRRRHTARWTAVVLLVVCAGLVAVLASRPPATATKAYSPLVGKEAPPVSGPTVDGGHFSLPRSPGHYVVLNFFASWCQPCQQEGPALVRFQFQHHARGDASMLSVVFEDTTAAARGYQATLGATWPTLADPGGQVASSFGVRAPPSTFVIAPDGRIVAFLVAPVTAADLDAIVQRAERSNP